MFEKQWKESFLHVPDPVFYGLMCLTFLAQIYMVYLSLIDLPPVISAVNIAVLILCAVYAVFRSKSGKIHIQSSISFE